MKFIIIPGRELKVQKMLGKQKERYCGSSFFICFVLNVSLHKSNKKNKNKIYLYVSDYYYYYYYTTAKSQRIKLDQPEC